MATVFLKVNPSDSLAELKAQVKDLATLLAERAQIVAFPTETVYGLGANALSDEAVGKIFTAKGRPSDNPLIVHVCDMAMALRCTTNLSRTAEKLIRAFWPGPLTVLVPARAELSAKCLAGQRNVGLRMPNHAVALALIEAAGVPVAAPSANLSGKPSPTKAEHVMRDLEGKIAGVIDGGPTGVGLESTVVDCTMVSG